MPDEPQKTRIQARNEAKILACALTAFSAHGLHGATMERIAELADMSQPNLHRYFATKIDLYRAVLARTLEDWFVPLTKIDAGADPASELRRYVSRKLELSRSNPEASRLFAHELLQGAPYLELELKGIVRPRVDEFAAIVEGWIDAGQLIRIDARHLVFMLWSTTQHYADFAPQVMAALGKTRLTKADFALAEETICTALFNGLLPRAGS